MDLYEFFRSKEVGSTEKKWSVIEARINENYEYLSSSSIGKNFYISTYECPYCNKPLYKTVFPVNREYQIYTKIKTINLKRVFTCGSCLAFFTAPTGSSLKDGILFTIRYDSEDKYFEKLRDMDTKGTTDGRDDL